MTGCVRARLEGILLLIDSHFRMAKHGQCNAVFLNSGHKKAALLRSFPKSKDPLFLRYIGLIRLQRQFFFPPTGGLDIKRVYSTK